MLLFIMAVQNAGPSIYVYPDNEIIVRYVNMKRHSNMDMLNVNRINYMPILGLTYNNILTIKTNFYGKQNPYVSQSYNF